MYSVDTLATVMESISSRQCLGEELDEDVIFLGPFPSSGEYEYIM